MFETFFPLLYNLMFFLTVHHNIDLFHLPTLMHNSFIQLTTCMLHYNPRHVSNINMPIFRRTNCIITASGIVTLCKRLYSMPDESRLQTPEDGNVNARNMSRIVL